MLRYLRDLFLTKGVPSVVITDYRQPFNSEEFKYFAREFDFKHQTSSPHFHQSNGFIKAMVKKVKATYKKKDESPNAQARALLQLRDTPITKDLPSPADILHRCPHKELSFPDVTDLSTYQESANVYLKFKTHKKNTSIGAHRAKDERVLTVNEQVRFFPQKQYGMKLQWLAGTVSEILEKGHSYIITGLNRKKYRRN